MRKIKLDRSKCSSLRVWRSVHFTNCSLKSGWLDNNSDIPAGTERKLLYYINHPESQYHSNYDEEVLFLLVPFISEYLFNFSNGLI